MTRQPLVLLPGTLCNARLFEPLRARLGDIANCIVADVAGSASLAALAASVLQAAPQRFALAGLSFGGIVAFEMMRQQPERVTRLALLNTTPLPPSDAMRARLTQFADMARSGQFRAITTEHLKDTMLHPDHQTDTALRRTILMMAEEVGQEGFLRQVCAQLERPDSTGDLAHIQCRTLVLTGRQDTVCTVAVHEAMAAHLPHAELVIVEDCGHLSPLEQPDAVAQAMRAWLAPEVPSTLQESGA